MNAATIYRGRGHRAIPSVLRAPIRQGSLALVVAQTSGNRMRSKAIKRDGKIIGRDPAKLDPRGGVIKTSAATSVERAAMRANEKTKRARCAR